MGRVIGRWWTLVRAVVIGAAVLEATVAGAEPTPQPHRPPNIILIVVDTLRADRVGGVYAQWRGLTPFLDELAGRGTRFTTAYAPSSWTCPSVASLLTSRYPSQHGVATFDSVLPPNEITLAESLAPLGYRAGGFTANFRLTADHGYAQGFSHWDAIFPPHPLVDAKVPGSRVRDELRGWLGTNPRFGTEVPLFLYLHYLEPHAPYEAPEPFRSRFMLSDTTPETVKSLNAKVTGFGLGLKGLRLPELSALSRLYDGEVAAVDAEIREMLAMLDAAGVLRNAVVVVTADHGEEFGEHGEVMHGHTLYNDAIRVPLIVVAPGAASGAVVDEPVSLLDVAPTLLALAGAAPEPRHQGRSLLPLLGDAVAPSSPPEPILAELLPLGAGGEEPGQRLHSAAIVAGNRKGLRGTTGALEVFDLADDPGERHPLPPLVAAESLDLLATAEAMEGRLREHAQPAGLARPLDDATKEKLRALGYRF